jgi:large subunit ribosomal protein L29
MKTEELRNKTDQELGELLLDLRRKQFNLRMQKASGQPAKASEVREARKDIARIKTIAEERRKMVAL